jgi:hypothetical protein
MTKSMGALLAQIIPVVTLAAVVVLRAQLDPRTHFVRENLESRRAPDGREVLSSGRAALMGVRDSFWAIVCIGTGLMLLGRQEIIALQAASGIPESRAELGWSFAAIAGGMLLTVIVPLIEQIYALREATEPLLASRAVRVRMLILRVLP